VAARRLIALLLVAVAVLAGALWWQARRTDEAKRALGLESARMVDAVFARTSELKVSTLSGSVVARSEAASGGLVPVSQTTRAPASVDYFVDLRAVRPGSYRWNEQARTLSVDVPDVVAARPNIDMARAEVRQQGMFISRAAGRAMQQQAAARLNARAEAEAARPENMARAREAARDAVARLFREPLRAAGLGQVRVLIRFPGERRPDGLSAEQWDRSRSLQEVLGDAR
jgi:hypothetical protein